MSYFKMFPTRGYDFNQDGVLQTVVDLYRSIRPMQNYVDDFTAYTYLNIENGERPDILSQRLYQTPDLHWTFFLVNDFLHDVLSSWPMSQEDIQQHISTVYNGWALETRPDVKYNSDGQITNYKDSLAGRFKLKETITGQTSGASGTLTKKDIYLNQLVVQDATGTFLGAGDGNSLEAVSGTSSSDTVSIWKAWKYEDAPHHWYRAGDGKSERAYVQDEFIGDGSTLSYVLSSVPYRNLDITVKVNGVKNSSWTRTANTSTLTFNSAPALNEVILISVLETNTDGTYKYGLEANVSNANFFSSTDDPATNLILQEGSVAAATYTSNRAFVHDLNDQRSKIRVVNPSLMYAFKETFEKLIHA